MIRSLKPNVTQEEALRTLRGSGFFFYLWRLRAGPLWRVADAYVPFRLYRVRYTLNKETVQRVFAMDAVDGSLDLFEFRTAPDEAEFVGVQTRNHMRTSLDAREGARILTEKVLRIIFQQGFFKLREASLKIEALPGEIHLPYWLGFYGTSDALRCRALDAVRRRIEGAKASAFFEQWLAA
ncbi:MAG: hypothetical protein NVS9B14_19870 [Candidatus Acidiferrum sp.]